jgi:hypothetical protein
MTGTVHAFFSSLAENEVVATLAVAILILLVKG